ncbi:MAG: class I SAM-dependent methyltransferase [Dokdonella sp.]
MSDYEYQYGFSLQNPEVFDAASREKKARSALAVLREAGRGDPATQRLLNVGASSGAMDAIFAQAFGHVVGIDIDEHAIAFAQQHSIRANLEFRIGDALDIPFAADTFDVVVCSQVYEHVPDQPRLFAEIRRVLRPGGCCYFAATNRLVLIEPHYRLPFLSWLPRPLANVYLRVLGRGNRYYERMHGLAELRRLTTAFRVVDFTQAMLADPARYEIEYMLRPGSLQQRVALLWVRWLPATFRGYIWLLYKDAEVGRV